MRIIEIEPETIESFRKSWPCSNLENVHHIVVAIHKGDLVDLEAFTDHEEFTPIDHELIDGPGLLALIDDAEKNANLADKPFMIGRWIY